MIDNVKVFMSDKDKSNRNSKNIVTNHFKYLLADCKWHWYIIGFLIFAFFFVGYRDLFMAWYDKKVLHYISQFSPNIFSLIVAFSISCSVIIMLIRRLKTGYRFDARILSIVICLLFVLSYYRFEGSYEYDMCFWKISYVDVVLVSGLLYVVSAIVNFVFKVVCIHNGSVGSNSQLLFDDKPINTANLDKLHLKDEAKKIAKIISLFDRNNFYSVSIVAPWGVGKTSFINMIINYLRSCYSDKFDIMYFNPRGCKSYQTIQEEFFAQMACLLSEYDSRCKGEIKEYMEALKLIDSRGVIEKFTSFYAIGDRADLRDKIAVTISSLRKGILVIIDDFDRLSKNEIVEVLKLIDSNAAFGNMVFLTAYDKMQVNKILGEENNTTDACFSDKFFDLEFMIPERAYSYIADYLKELLCNGLKLQDGNVALYADVIYKHLDLFQKYIPTIRDVKRYVNQIIVDYEQLMGELVIEEYMLLELIKYKYPDEYKSLYKKAYIEKGSFLNKDRTRGDVYYQKKEVVNQLGCFDILLKIFPQDDNQINSFYNHVYECRSFDKYFVNQIFGKLRISEMQKIFYDSWEDVISKIDDWLQDNAMLSEFLAYLNSFDMDNFSTGDFFKRYSMVVAYVSVKEPSRAANGLMMRLTHKPNLEGYEQKYQLDFLEYKKSLVEVITNTAFDQALTYARSLHYDFITKRVVENDCILKDQDIWPLVKKNFLTFVDARVDEDALLAYFYCCVDNMVPETRKLIIDKDCAKAYRSHIEAAPSWYVEKFVRLGGVSSDPSYNSVACEPCWDQIFINEKSFIDFLSTCKENSVPGTDVIEAFWELYRANEYRPIEFHGQGIVQDKINNRFGEELVLLSRIKDIEEDVNRVTENELSDVDKSNLQSYLDQLSKIKLSVSLKGKIRRKIEKKLAK